MNSTDCSSLPVVFMTWFRHRRTTEISRHLQIQLIELITDRRGLARYLELTLRTISILRRMRPKVLIVQSPSLVLSILALLLRPLLRYSLVVDAHNEAVEPYLNTSKAVLALTHWVLRRADRIIVTNPPLAEKVAQRGGRPVVLPDRIPETPPLHRQVSTSGFHIVVISTFAGDEPLDVVLGAAQQLASIATFSITGNAAKLPPRLKPRIGSNVKLTGFLEEVDYWSLLASCDMVMDLTTMEDCLVCGAYEAIAVGTPLILSDNRASAQLFYDAALFTPNTSDAVVATVHRAIEQHQVLTSKMTDARARIERLWQVAAEEMVAILRSLAAHSNQSASA